MAKYCRYCGNQVSPEEKFCKNCGKAIEESPEASNVKQVPAANAADAAYEFYVDKATFKYMSTPIHTTVTLQNNILSTSMTCKSKMLSTKALNAQVNLSDIYSVKYTKYASVALFDLFLFGILLVAAIAAASYLLWYALLAGVILWRTLIPSLEITTKDKQKINILFSPIDSKKEMFKLVAQLTGKETDANSELKIPFSKKPFIAALVFLIVGFVLAALFA